MKRALFVLLLLSLFASAAQLNPRGVGDSRLTLRLEWVFEPSSQGGSHHLTTFAFPSTSFQTSDCRSNDSFTTGTDAWGNTRLRFEWPATTSEKRVTLTADLTVNYANAVEAATQASEYVKESPLVLLTPEASSQAAAIVKGAQTDFERAARLSEWVHNNVAYDPSQSYFTKTSQEVLSNRSGVCSEYSHLLLALLRVQGIPSRFVAGFVYSGEAWGPHAWVEAAIDGKWVAFDPTFNEAGVLDATHVKFAHGRDHGDVTEEITEGLTLEKPPIQVTVQETSNFSLPFRLGFLRAPSLVGAGSLETVSIEVESLSNSEQAVPLYLTVPTSPPELAVTVSGDKDKLLYLPSRAKRSANWSLVFPTAMQEGGVYEFTVYAASLGAEKTAAINGRKDAEASVVEKLEIRDLKARIEGEALTINADLANTGSVDANALVSCVFEGQEQKSNVEVGIGKKRALQFVFQKPAPGKASGSLTVITRGQTFNQPFEVAVPEPQASAQAAGQDNLPAFAAIAIIVVIAAAVIVTKIRPGYEEV